MKEEFNIDLPGDDDENIGEGSPKKKKEKKRKSSEERKAERRVVFLTLIVVTVVTFAFWLIPIIKTGTFEFPAIEIGKPDIKVNLPNPEWKGYMEYELK
jgi:hypothetical protein